MAKNDGFDLSDRGRFLNLAGLVEGGLVFVAVGLGWIADIHPFDAIQPSWTGLAFGVAAAVPLLAVFALAYRYPFGPLQPIKRLLHEFLGPALAACRWYDLVLFAALAGLGEELLFRGVLQPWFGRAGAVAGLVGSNLLFGMAHLITPTYGLFAGLMGLYLGLVQIAAPSQNLLAPIVTHAVYDYVAFVVVAHDYRRSTEA